MRKPIIILIALLAIGFKTRAQRVIKVGDTIYNIALKSTKGDVYDLKKQKVKGFVLVFMTPSCSHCLAYVNRVAALDKLYKPKGYPVVAIGPYGDNDKDYPYDGMAAMKKLATEKGFTFPYLADEKFKYTWLFNIRETPKVVVLTKHKYVYRVTYIGHIDDEPDERKVPKEKFVELEINKLLIGKVH